MLLHEVIDYCNAVQGGSFLDCTLGGGGHTRALLEANTSNRVVAADRDGSAVVRGSSSLAHFGDRITIMQASFSELVNQLQHEKFHAVLADLGISSDQLADGRGFSFEDSGELDMRMDERQKLCAGDLVNNLSEQELFVLFKQGGVGREARALARRIIKIRPIKSTAELTTLVRSVVPKQKRTDPATIAFQALRMAVNHEREELVKLLDIVPSLVIPGGRLVAISFHSIEDQLVTKAMRGWQQPESEPALWGGPPSTVKSLGTLLTRKAVVPSQAEIDQNPRSRSARMRVFEFGSSSCDSAG